MLRNLFGDDSDVLYERDFQLLLVSNIAGPLGIAMISPVLDSLISPFGTTAANIGLLISFITAPGIVMYPISGRLADRFGRKPVLVSSLVVFGLAGSMIAFTTNFQFILFLRLIQGVAYGGVLPIIITSIGDIYTGNKETTAQGLRFSGSGIMSAALPVFSGVLIALTWKLPFLLYASTIPIALIVHLYLDEPSNPDFNNSTALNSNQMSSSTNQFLKLLRQRHVLAVVLARGSSPIIWIGFLTINSIVVVQIYNETPASAGILVALVSLSEAIAGSQTGRINSLFANRFFPLVSAHLLLGFGFIIFLFSPSIWIASLGITLLGFGVGVVLPTYRSMITGFTERTLRGGLIGVSESFGRVSLTVTPIFLGFAIAITEPTLGLINSIRYVGLGVAFIGSISGILFLYIAFTSIPNQNNHH